MDPVRPDAVARPAQSPELSVVVPTFKEAANVPRLVELLDAALAGIAWEVIFVDDDSPDGTARVAKAISARDPRVRCLRRVGRRGLAGACIEGMLSSAAPVVAVMDADLQHDETILPQMFAAIRDGAELVVGSRYVDGGSSGQGLSSVRQWGSETATSLARRFLKIELSDPMSGFFMIRRDKVEAIASKLSREGFKILLDIVASSPERLKTVEIPFTFRERQAGESKLDSLVTAEYLGLLFSKLSGGLVPVRFLMFLSVGASGIIVHLAALKVALHVFATTFFWGELAATVVAMTWNFILNNQLTYRDRRLTGLRFVWGLLTFYLVCSLGTIANMGVATGLFETVETGPWVAGFAGAVLSAVFNYTVSAALTWRK
ncbi:glycosyltransferase [Pinisolibacter aquiterrae]|uniref:glycosyltransferase n=1 Tax=Pinisolibacter aquiterrae TaxID=2815579 RepID=UPI001C3E6BF1|nr:glycosyltransferase family 2 protein [Pinisolibacter aquiterrae]MBV5266706.1 glycosyltransferase family 2 protein [Pinisolibacter aquiterrae]MCC8234981.1 glycosyltransferase family 2 protein [Pinisolibacter aquiterrae]